MCRLFFLKETIMKFSFIAAISLALTIPAVAQPLTTSTWPTKTIRVIVPYGAGSTPDTIARLIFDKVQKNAGQAVVVENKPGAAGMIGTDLVAKAAPDGHTLVIAPSGPLATNALLYKKMPYNAVKDLSPVALIAETPTVLVASNGVGVSNAKELMKSMSEPKSRMAYASPGAGTLGHLNMAYLVSRAEGADIPHVPYAGSPQIITALIANDVQMAALPPLAVAQHVKAGKIRAIGTIGPKRSSALPELPTLREQGIDFAPVGWFGIATTGGTPPEVVNIIYRHITTALNDPDVIAYYRTQGLDSVESGPKSFSAYIADEVARWKPVIQKFNISLD
jgi:tripartite-type tricarboxylate transporter receptor subunit TctC